MSFFVVASLENEINPKFHTLLYHSDNQTHKHIAKEREREEKEINLNEYTNFMKNFIHINESVKNLFSLKIISCQSI